MFEFAARLSAKRPAVVLTVWALVLLACLPFSLRVGEVLTGQPEAPRSGEAASVRSLLASDFAQGEEETLVIVAHGFNHEVGTPGYDAALDELGERLSTVPGVTYVRDYRSAAGINLLDEENGFSIVQVGLGTSGTTEGKTAAKRVRVELNRLRGLRFDVSGGPATLIELESVSERDARQAELFGLPISLLILLVAFGAVVASALPLASALVTVVVSTALLFALGQLFEFAVFTATIVTMLGLATGIDYALLMVSRYREELRAGLDPREAAAATTMTAGKAVAFSGLTVLVALGALLVPPIGFIRSIGVGSMVVLAVSVLVAVSAVPAVLALLGPKINRLKVTRREPGLRSHAFWRARAEAIMCRPWTWATVGVATLLLIAAPAVRMQVADPGPRGLSEATEARRTLDALSQLGLEGVLNPFDAVVDFGSSGFFDARNVRLVSLLSQELSELEGVAGVLSPFGVEAVPRILLYGYYATEENALGSEIAPLVRATVSTSGRYVLFRAYPHGALTPAEGARLRDEIAGLAEANGLKVKIGGTYMESAEWASALYQYFPLALTLVAIATALLLGVAFRSVVIPIKAVLLNVLTVGAAFGAITVFLQGGLLGRIFGSGPGLGFVDTSAPLFIFAIVFGLSMDYEVFLVARIREGHENGLSDREAVAEAMATTGGVITSAAAVMVTIFTVMMFSHVELIRSLGVGLSVAVLLDATLVRLALVPSVMVLAGKWNWWLPWSRRR